MSTKSTPPHPATGQGVVDPKTFLEGAPKSTASPFNFDDKKKLTVELPLIVYQALLDAKTNSGKELRILVAEALVLHAAIKPNFERRVAAAEQSSK
ncbi:hypothetical protein [Actinoplanes sp. GCM10030250]|uniref:hypothetical protein n=1 Tax=Actinoplanes sp. GCM10030250 TaxID=3273376 RepID=UPI00361DE82C